MQSPNNNNPAPRIIAAAIFCAIGVLASYCSLAAKSISEPSFLFLVSLVVVATLVIAFVDRIQSFSLRDLKVEFARVEAAREDVEARAREVRQVAFALAEITLFIATLKDRIRRDANEPDVQTAWLESKVRELLNAISAAPEEQANTFRLFAAAKEMDRLRGTISDEESERQWDEIRKQIVSDTKPRA